MAKKKDNTLLYAGIAAAAILLLKKKDTGMAGVGSSRKEELLMKLHYGGGLTEEEYNEYRSLSNKNNYGVQNVTARKQQIIVADSFDPKTGYMEYEVNGKRYWVQGDHYYNRRKERYEHTHYGPRGGEYLIVVYR